MAKPKAPTRADELMESVRDSIEMPESLAAELAARGRKVGLRKGMLLYQRGDAPDALYRLTRGSIRVSTTSSDGRELVLTDLKPGEFFGEVSLLDELPRTHDARATEKSEILVVPAERFRALLTERPALAQHFLRSLASKVRLCFAVIEGAMQSVERRLVLRLLWLAEQRGPGARNLGAISQGDLAAMVGATRQSINKELQALQQLGVIELKGRTLTLLDLPKLRSFAGL